MTSEGNFKNILEDETLQETSQTRGKNPKDYQISILATIILRLVPSNFHYKVNS